MSFAQIPDVIQFPGGEVWISTQPGSMDFIPEEIIHAEGYSPPRGSTHGARSGRSSTGFGSFDRQPRSYDREFEGFYRRRNSRPMTPEEKQEWYDLVWGKK